MSIDNGSVLLIIKFSFFHSTKLVTIFKKIFNHGFFIPNRPVFSFPKEGIRATGETPYFS